METPWFKKWAKQASDAIENARVTIEDNVTKNQPHVESMLRHLGDNVASAAQNIQRNLAGDPTTRGPLTEAEIDSLDMVYLTPRIIASAYPINRSLGAPRQPVAQGNPIELMAALLHQSHQGRYMVWNISEESYDYAYFQDQVLEFRFPGHPAPPLGMLFNICTSIENWLEADPANVAVVHCLTGRGRTATVLACLLAWLGAAAAAPGEALACVSAAKGVPVERLTIPSQRRYVQYFANVLDGVRPRSEPLLLRRVIMNTIPRFGEHGGAEGCCPYIQIFKAGRLVFTATYTPPAARRDSPPRRRRQSSDEGGGGGDAAPQQQQQRPETAAAAAEGGGVGVGPGGAAAAQAPMQWAYASDESVAFGVDCVLQGDLLLRGRHLGARGERVSMFRAAFHTGYVPCGVLRLGRAQLDGACDDARFDQDFFLDLIFAPVERPSCGEASAAAAVAPPSKPSPKSAAAAAPFTDDGGGAAAVAAVAAAAREAGLVVNPEATEAYDSMLHRDAQFWEDIEARKARHAERRAGGGGGEHVPSAYSQPLERPPATATDLRNRFSITVDDGDDDTAAQRRSARGSLASPSKRLAAAAAAAAAGRKGSNGGGGGGISDADLLAQLAEAEGDDEFGGSSSGGGSSHGALLRSVSGLVDALPPVPPAPAPAAAAEQPDAAAGAAAAARADAANDESAANAAAPPAQPSATAAAADGGSAPAGAAASHEPAAALAAPAAAFELSALDELEKELGIASLGAGGSAEAPAAAAAAAMAAEEEFDLGGDDFDGFESYLESLAGGGGGGKAEGT